MKKRAGGSSFFVCFYGHFRKFERGPKVWSCLGVFILHLNLDCLCEEKTSLNIDNGWPALLGIYLELEELKDSH